MLTFWRQYKLIEPYPAINVAACALMALGTSHFLSPLHEIGHYVVGRLKGYQATFAFNHVTFSSPSAIPDVMIAVGGPLSSMLWGLLISYAGLSLWKSWGSRTGRNAFWCIFLMLLGVVTFVSDGVYNLIPDPAHPFKDGSRIFSTFLR